MRIAEWSIKNATVTWVITFILAFGGMLVFQDLSRLEDPEFTIKEAIIFTPYPGASASEVETEVSDLIERASEAFGPIDILVNNAAGSYMKMPSQATSAERSFMFDLNVNAPVDLAQQAIEGMQQRGAGWILNISSATSVQPALPYRDSKEAALIIGPLSGH